MRGVRRALLEPLTPRVSGACIGDPCPSVSLESGRAANGSPLMTEERLNVNRVGIFLCECGDEIKGAVDLGRLRRELRKTDPTASIHVAPYWCSGTGRRSLEEILRSEHIDAVVVAGCSNRTHGGLVAELCERAGVNRNRIAMANLREHCARTHDGTRSAATTKALRLVRVGIARASLALPLEPIVSEVERSAVVVGAGVTGLTAARALAARDVRVTLLEKEAELGGILSGVNQLFPSYCDGALYIGEMSGRAVEDDNIDVLTESRIVDVSGHAGAYVLTIETGSSARELSAGCVVLATGADVLAPAGLFAYGDNPKVVTQLEFEGMLRDGLEGIKRVVMIQCVGSRNADRPYCSRVCCTATVKNTMTVLEEIPDAEITVLSRGFAQYVGDLDRAREAGVTFLRYDPERAPRVHSDVVDVFDVISSSEVSIPYDLVVLATPLVPRRETAELAKLFGLPIDDQGFVAEPHTKLRPGAFAPSGVFVAGSAHWPSTVTECQSQAYGAASRAADLLDQGSIERDPIVAVVDELACRGCGECEEACAHSAIALSEADDGMKTAKVDEVICVGCGVCTQVCPSSAVNLKHLTPKQLLGMVDAAVGA